MCIERETGKQNEDVYHRVDEKERREKQAIQDELRTLRAAAAQRNAEKSAEAFEAVNDFDTISDDEEIPTPSSVSAVKMTFE